MRAKADDAFTQARRRGLLRPIPKFFSGAQPDSLLSFDEVRAKLKVRGQHYAGLQSIPLNKIAGSVGRYQEFIREWWKRVYEEVSLEQAAAEFWREFGSGSGKKQLDAGVKRAKRA